MKPEHWNVIGQHCRWLLEELIHAIDHEPSPAIRHSPRKCRGTLALLEIHTGREAENAPYNRPRERSDDELLNRIY